MPREFYEGGGEMKTAREKLEARALFGCRFCEEEYSWPAKDLAWIDDKDLVCSNCYDGIPDPPMKDDEIVRWDELPTFDPFTPAIKEAQVNAYALASRVACPYSVSQVSVGKASGGSVNAMSLRSGISEQILALVPEG